MVQEFSGLLKCIVNRAFFKRPTKMFKIDILVGTLEKYQSQIPVSRR